MSEPFTPYFYTDLFQTLLRSNGHPIKIFLGESPIMVKYALVLKDISSIPENVEGALKLIASEISKDIHQANHRALVEDAKVYISYFGDNITVAAKVWALKPNKPISTSDTYIDGASGI